MRNDLYRAAEIIAAALLADDAFVDLTGGEIIPPAHLHVGEALVMAEIQVCLGAILGDEDLAVLERAHRSRIDVDIRIELEIGDADTTGSKYLGPQRVGEA